MRGLQFDRVNTREGESVWDTVVWTRRDVAIQRPDGTLVFSQREVEAPKAWSDQAVRIAASKYFAHSLGEQSIRSLIARVVDTIVEWARQSEFFSDAKAISIFGDELIFLLLHQQAAFNSPIWFNLGVEKHPQCSACFINSVEDTLASILDLAKTEGMLFKYGSGSGTNLSVLRASTEASSKGVTAAGPLGFMRGFDAFASAIKSGGRTRRAAKMVVLDADHPDICEFIGSKAREEKKAWALIDAGFDGSLDGEAYKTVAFQNANHSVRVPNAFWMAVDNDGPWRTRNRIDGRVSGEYSARRLLLEIAQAAWGCGDPGVHYESAIQKWHTCKASGPIRASNPCSEYLFLDDTACNLASLNLMAFLDGDGELDVARFEPAVRLLLTAQEILVDRASYPTAAIRNNSQRFRPLGLGYANLGAVLMRRGTAYDSEEAREFAGSVTALLSGIAYHQSATMAWEGGAFTEFERNRDAMLQVIGLHCEAAERLTGELATVAQQAWQSAMDLGQRVGFRNAQVSVLAPTGTIGLLMDCDTFGVEPEFALVKVKRLSGGGTMILASRVLPAALDRLGYDENQRRKILEHVERSGAIEGAPDLRPEHLAVFDCSFAHSASGRVISTDGHLRMMAAIQPFLSGGISKTVNLPNSTNPEVIASIFQRGYELGLKSVAIYRDGCKRVQPLSLQKPPREQRPLPQANVIDRIHAPCQRCGGAQLQSGSCLVCSNCGETTACG